MRKIVINGLFTAQQLSGAQRYAYEIIRELDVLSPPGFLKLAVPIDSDTQVKYNNIQIEIVGKRTGRLWEQIDLPYYIKKEKSLALNFCNTAPIVSPGIVSILDCGYKNWKQIKEVASTPTKRLSRDVQNFFYCRRSKALFTLTQSSKNDVEKFFHPNKEIHIVGCGWEHYNRIGLDEKVFDQFPEIGKGQYFFAMSNLSEHKNFKWVIEIAKNNPQHQFVISGATNPRHFVFDEDLFSLKNLVYVGRVSDEQAKTLMNYCKAFLFPSFYEGFGLPPLEALCLGKECIISDIPTHKEIYAQSVHYIDPRNYNYNLDDVLEEKTFGKQEVLANNTWAGAAQTLFSIIKSI